MLAFNLLAGMAADRFDRRRLMIVSDVVAGVALATLAAATIAVAVPGTLSTAIRQVPPLGELTHTAHPPTPG